MTEPARQEPPQPWSADRAFIPAGPMKVPLAEVGPKLGRILEMRQSLPPPPPPPPAPPGRAEEPEEPEPRGKVVAGIISSERIAFLERVEAVMALDRRNRELEEENRALIRALGRLQGELDQARKGK